MRRAVLLLSFTFLAVAFAAAQNKTTIKTVPLHRTATLEGAESFSQYCATCHGKDGKGNGPAADALKKRPADLTQIALRNNGKFRELVVENAITGDDIRISHGSRDMPIWGELFKSVSVDPSVRRLRIFSLVKYIEQMQEK